MGSIFFPFKEKLRRGPTINTLIAFFGLKEKLKSGPTINTLIGDLPGARNANKSVKVLLSNSSFLSLCGSKIILNQIGNVLATVHTSDFFGRYSNLQGISKDILT